MILHLVGGEKIDIGDKCSWGWINNRTSFNTKTVNHNCNPVEVLANHNTDGHFFKVGQKYIPVTNVAYVDMGEING